MKRILTGCIPALALLCLLTGCQAVMRPRQAPNLEAVLARTQPAAVPADIPDELTLPAAKHIALAHSPDLKAAQARIAQAVARLKQARASYYPSLSVGASTTYSRHTPEYQTVDGDSDQFWIYNAGASASWILFNGLSREFNELAAAYGQDSSRYAHQDVQRQLANGVAAAFLNALTQKRLMEAAAADAEFNQSLLDEVRKRMAVQKAARTEELNFLIAVNNAQTAFLTAQENYHLARIGLAELLGLKDVELPAQIVLIQPEIPEDKPMDAKQLIAAALDRPDLQAALAQLQATEAGAKAQAGELWPSLSVNGSYGASRPGDMRFTSDDRDADISASLQWDLDLGGRKRNAYREAVAALKETEARFENAYRDVVAEVRSRLAELESARQQLALQEKTYALSEEQRDLIRKSWQAGRVSITRLNEAQNALIRAQANLSTSRIRVLVILENLRAATNTNRPE